MKIIPERVTVLSDVEKSELTILMEGFRITLSGEEARALGYALTQGVKQLYPETGTRPPLSAGFTGRPAPVAALQGEVTATPELRSVGGDGKPTGDGDGRRSLTA